MYKKPVTTILLPGLFILSCNLFAQSPGGIEQQSIWLKGNFSPGAAGAGVLNFNPAMAINDNKTAIKMPGSIKSLRGVTIFTVYQQPYAADEKKVWEITGDFGDLSLSDRQVLSKSRKTNIVFAKNKQESYKQERYETIIHTYVSHGGRGIAENAENKEASIRFGNPTGSVNNPGRLISEFILYQKVLSEEEIAKVETYLALKYGITLEKNYLNAAGETIWDREIDKTYSNNLAGIARDDKASLYQKQSTSCNTAGELVIGINKIVQSNSGNTGKINNGDYLIWGDNGQSPTLDENVEACTSEIVLPAKRWLMKISGSAARTTPTELKIDTKIFLPGHFPGKDFCLVIDRPGSGDFAPGNCSYILPDHISPEGIASFSGLLWDTDGSGKDIFTFGFKPGVSPDPEIVKNKDAVNLISFLVYPNPVSDGHYKIAITLDRPTDIKVQVYNLHQQLVDSKKGEGRASYLFPGYINGAPGPYTIRVITPGKEFSRMIILQ